MESKLYGGIRDGMYHSDFLPERIRVRIFCRSLADFLDTGLVASSGRLPHSDSFLIGFRYCYCNFETNAYATCAQLCCTLVFFCNWMPQYMILSKLMQVLAQHGCPRSSWLGPGWPPLADLLSRPCTGRCLPDCNSFPMAVSQIWHSLAQVTLCRAYAPIPPRAITTCTLSCLLYTSPSPRD